YARFSATDNFCATMSFAIFIIMSYNDIILAKLRNTRQAVSLHQEVAIYSGWPCKSEVSLSSGIIAGAPGDQVGTHLVKKSASAAASTTINSATRNAARRASAFICNTASMVAVEAPCASRAVCMAV